MIRHIYISRCMLAFFLLVPCLISEGETNKEKTDSPFASQPAIHGFEPAFFSLSDGTEAGIGSDNKLYMSKDPAKEWVAVSEVPKNAKASIVGGTEKRVYFEIELPKDQQKSPESSPSKSVYRLMTWDSVDGVKVLKEVPKGPCSFSAEGVGAYAEGTAICTTTDGGKTWSAPQQVCKDREVQAVKVLSRRRLIVSGGESVLSLWDIDDEGHTKKKWEMFTDDAGIVAISDEIRGEVWPDSINGSAAYSTETGKSTKNLGVDGFEHCIAIANHVFLCSTGNVGIDIWESQKPALIQHFAGISAVAVLASGSGYVIVEKSGKMQFWNPDHKAILTPLDPVIKEKQ